MYMEYHQCPHELRTSSVFLQFLEEHHMAQQISQYYSLPVTDSNICKQCGECDIKNTVSHTYLFVIKRYAFTCQIIS